MKRLRSSFLILALLFVLLAILAAIAVAQDTSGDDATGEAVRLGTPANLRHVSGATIVWTPTEIPVKIYSEHSINKYQIVWTGPDNIEHNAFVRAPATQYAIPNLQHGLNYQVRVRAERDIEAFVLNSLWSDTFTFTMPPQTLPTPAGLRKIGNSAVAWNAVANVSEYRIVWKGSDNYRHFGTAPSSQTQFSIPNLNAGQSYDVQVRSIGDGVRTLKSAWSGVLRLSIPHPTATPTPTPIPVAAPSNLRHLGNGVIAWDAVPGAKSYILSWTHTGKGGGSLDIPGHQTQAQAANMIVGLFYRAKLKAYGTTPLYEFIGPWSGEIEIFLPTPTPTNTPTPTFTPTATNTPVPTDTPTPIPTPGPVKKLRSGGVFTDAFGVDWEKPTVGVNQSTVYRVEYMDPWSDDWNYAGTTDKLSYYKNEPGWSGEFGIRVRAEGNNGTGPWSRISVSVA